MQIESTPLAGIVVLVPRRIEDVRGYFSEVWNRRSLADLGIDIDFVQDNHSLSREAGVVRGLHYQSPPSAQDKLVRVVAGAVFDVAVDIRVASPTFGKWFGVELSAENGKQLLIPKGFLHGFVTRAPNTEVVYKCSDFYDPECDGAIRYDDPDIGIDWGIAAAAAITSDKDAAAPAMADFESPFRDEG